MALLTAENLTRRFGGIVACDGVSFEIRAGEIVGLIGPNGAGKTTVFNLITRLYKPNEGDIVFDGRSLLHTPPHRIAGLGIARTFQNVELFQQMSVLDNILVGAHSRGWRAAAGARERALEILDYVGLRGLAHREASGLPFGTLKRIEIARALAAEPKLLLLDEPAGGLNHEEVAELEGFIRRLREDFDLTILLVEHHMNLVMHVSNEVHVLDFGRMIASGTPDEVRANARVIEAYLGVEADAAA
jgi:branched-chain amino acid transport system ATP-binding protein